jgi:hypothetical protein
MKESGREAEIAQFLDEQGRLRQLPAKNRKKILALDYLAGKFEQGRVYSEPEINEQLTQWHTFGDFHLLRRLLVDYGLLNRVPDGSRYWLSVEGKEESGADHG